MFFGNLIYYLFPYKSLEYLSKYFDTSRLISQKDTKSVYQIYLLQCLLFFKSVHYVILYFTSTKNPIQTVAIFDDTYLFSAQREIMQVFFFLMVYMIIYFYQKVYLKPNSIVIDFLEEILFKNKSKYFFKDSENYKTFKSLQSKTKNIIVFTQVYVFNIGIKMFK